MAAPTEDEMMSDLAAADAAGDTELAQHIAGRIKSLRTPAVGMGDVQAAPSARVGAGNVPATLLTGDPATDERISRNLATSGASPNNITGSDVAHAAAITAGLLVPEAGLGLAGATAGGGLLSGGLSRAKDAAGVAWDAAKGAGLSYGAGRLLQGAAGLVARRAQGKVAAAAEKAAQQAAAEKDAEVRSLEGAARERTANAYRQMERIELALKNPALPSEERAALESFKQTPEYLDLLRTNARSIGEAAPTAVGELQAARQVADEARSALPEAIKARQAELLSPEQAREQIMARAKRYGPPAIGSAVGTALGGPVGGAVGSLGGAGTRPMVHSLRRMMQDPAVATSVWSPLARLAEPAEAASPTASVLPFASSLAQRRMPRLLIERVPAAAEGSSQ